MNNILLAYYGDDFTGSTDALEFLCKAGAHTMLFIEPPTKQQLDKYADLHAYGVAGKTRALPPAEMETILLPAFEMLKASGARHVHYKTCSTFDSSPDTGSIGKAIDCGASVFNNKLIPLLVAAPVLGRYCVFGNLFARMGIGSKGDIYRLDRHPSMSKHPVTPMDESDLRRHLSKQTDKKVGLIDILQFERPVAAMYTPGDGEEIVLIDGLYEEQLLKAGQWIEQQAVDSQALFSVGSSGIEMALGKVWNEKAVLKSVTEWPKPARVESLLVVSGSCSPVTAAQINWAKANGFEEVVINAVQVCNADRIEPALIDKLSILVEERRNVIVHTGAKQESNLPSEKLGTALGEIARKLTEQTRLKRVVFSGGDSSSYAARAMQIEAVTMLAPMMIGAPLCKAISQNKAVNGLEVNFKGGQVGSENYFGVMAGSE